MIDKKTDTILTDMDNIYEQNKIGFIEFENIINCLFDISNNVSKPAIKRMLLPSLLNSTRINLINNKAGTIISSVCLFFLSPFLIIYCLMCFFKKKVQKKKYDFAFDCWSSNREVNIRLFNIFYKNLFCKLQFKNNVILTPYIFKKKDRLLENEFGIDILSNDLLLHSKKSRIILFNFLKYFYKIITLSYKYNINFVLLFIKFLRQYLTAMLNIQGYDISFLISHGDNQYGPVTYDVYKKNGLKNLYLIQNGLRAKVMLSSYFISCDKYFSLEKNFKNSNLKLFSPEGIKYTGSWALYDKILKYKDNEIKYDVVFLEQGGADSTSAINYRDNFFMALKMIAKFSNEFKNVTILYSYKPTIQDDGFHDKFIQKRDTILNNCKIIKSKVNENSYHALSESNLVVYCSTTLGIEAISLGKKVLCCNFIGLNHLLSNQDEIGVIINNDYSLFCKKLLHLLGDDNSVEEYFKNKLDTLGRLDKNPVDIMLNEIKISGGTEISKWHRDIK